MQDPSREQLAREHLDLVEKLVGFMQKRFGSAADIDELRSFAMMGLARAIDTYDETRGVPFESFAGIKIKGAMYDGLADASWFPRRLYRQIAFYRKVDEMSRSAAQDPSPSDRVEAAHRLADRLKEMATAYITTYAAEGDNEEATSPARAEYSVDRKRYHAMVRAYVGTLPQRQQVLLRKFFYEDVALKDIATEMGVSRSWATRLLQAALANLRRNFDEAPEPLESFQPE